MDVVAAGLGAVLSRRPRRRCHRPVAGHIAGRRVPVAGATVDYAMSRAEGAGRARSAIRGGFGTTIASLAAIPAGTVCSAAGPFAAVGCATGAGLAGNSVGSSLGDWWYDQWYGAGGRVRGVFG